MKLLNYEERIGNDQHTSAVESRLKKEIENLQLEKKALLQDIDVKIKLFFEICFNLIEINFIFLLDKIVNLFVILSFAFPANI